jgi:hypothetical protein
MRERTRISSPLPTTIPKRKAATSATMTTVQFPLLQVAETNAPNMDIVISLALRRSRIKRSKINTPCRTICRAPRSGRAARRRKSAAPLTLLSIASRQSASSISRSGFHRWIAPSATQGEPPANEEIDEPLIETVSLREPQRLKAIFLSLRRNRQGYANCNLSLYRRGSDAGRPSSFQLHD